MSCSHIKTCVLFPQFSLHANLRIWQSRYCEGEFTKCERFQRSSRGEPVAITLLPNGTSLGDTRLKAKAHD